MPETENQFREISALKKELFKIYNHAFKPSLGIACAPPRTFQTTTAQTCPVTSLVEIQR